MPNYGIYKQATGDNQAIERVILTRLNKEAIINSYFGPLMGKGEDAIVQVKTDLEKTTGDTISFGIRMKLKGRGVRGDARIKGREQTPEKFMCDLVLDESRQAVAFKNGMTRQRDSVKMLESNEVLLRDWMEEEIDQQCFDAVYLNNTNQFYGGDATSLTDLAVDDELTPALCLKLKTIAKTGFYRKFNPILPVVIKGKKYWKVLVSEGARDKLINNPTMKEYLINAYPKDIQENPLMSTADLLVHGLIIEGHERVRTGTTVNGIAYSDNIILGAQALMWAWGEQPSIKKETDDYEHEVGYCIGMINGVKAPTYATGTAGANQTFNSMVVTTSEERYV